MVRLTPAVLLLGALLVGFRSDVRYQTVAYPIEPKSRLYISGTSNVNSFDCQYMDQFKVGTATVGRDTANRTLYFSDLNLLVPTKGLDCDNSKINSDLCDALKAEKYPYIKVNVHDATLLEGALDVKGRSGKIRANATITITNQSRKVALDVKATRLESNRVRLVSSKTLKMTDFGVEPPSVLFGLIRVRDDITINFDLHATILSN
jgi:polyisoprenoid-binding protein YceI